MADYRQADLDPATRALLDYALKLTLTPAAMTEQDVHVLKAVGFSDPQILSANLVTSYFNFINRVADGLGVDLEPEMNDVERPPPWSGSE